VLNQGKLTVPTGQGVGVAFHLDVLQKYTKSTERILLNK
ncbi:o-succinylbenzoate synthase, partial [Listeria monocytogenes]|nr:o-succinylbenzoate synthase [Listeria monocytogenes]